MTAAGWCKNARVVDSGYGFYDVVCACGFRLVSLSTLEAAEDTRRWHSGEPSYLADVERSEVARQGEALAGGTAPSLPVAELPGASGSADHSRPPAAPVPPKRAPGGSPSQEGRRSMNEPSMYRRRLDALQRLDEAIAVLEKAQERYLAAQEARDAANAEWAAARFELDALTKVSA